MPFWNVLPKQANLQPKPNVNARRSNDSFQNLSLNYELDINYNPDKESVQLQFIPQKENSAKGKNNNSISNNISQDMPNTGLADGSEVQFLTALNNVSDISSFNTDKLHHSKTNSQNVEQATGNISESVRKHRRRNKSKSLQSEDCNVATKEHRRRKTSSKTNLKLEQPHRLNNCIPTTCPQLFFALSHPKNVVVNPRNSHPTLENAPENRHHHSSRDKHKHRHKRVPHPSLDTKYKESVEAVPRISNNCKTENEKDLKTKIDPDNYIPVKVNSLLKDYFIQNSNETPLDRSLDVKTPHSSKRKKKSIKTRSIAVGDDVTGDINVCSTKDANCQVSHSLLKNEKRHKHRSKSAALLKLHKKNIDKDSLDTVYAVGDINTKQKHRKRHSKSINNELLKSIQIYEKHNIEDTFTIDTQNVSIAIPSEVVPFNMQNEQPNIHSTTKMKTETDRRDSEYLKSLRNKNIKPQDAEKLVDELNQNAPKTPIGYLKTRFRKKRDVDTRIQHNDTLEIEHAPNDNNKRIKKKKLHKVKSKSLATENIENMNEIKNENVAPLKQTLTQVLIVGDERKKRHKKRTKLSNHSIEGSQIEQTNIPLAIEHGSRKHRKRSKKEIKPNIVASNPPIPEATQLFDINTIEGLPKKKKLRKRRLDGSEESNKIVSKKAQSKNSIGTLKALPGPNDIDHILLENSAYTHNPIVIQQVTYLKDGEIKNMEREQDKTYCEKHKHKRHSKKHKIVDLEEFVNNVTLKSELNQSKNMIMKLPSIDDLKNENLRTEVSFSHLNKMPIATLYRTSLTDLSEPLSHNFPPCLVSPREIRQAKLKSKLKSVDKTSVVSEAITKQEKTHCVGGNRFQSNRFARNFLYYGGVTERCYKSTCKTESSTLGFTVEGVEPPKMLKAVDGGVFTNCTSSTTDSSGPTKCLQKTVLSGIEIKSVLGQPDVFSKNEQYNWDYDTMIFTNQKKAIFNKNENKKVKSEAQKASSSSLESNVLKQVSGAISLHSVNTYKFSTHNIDSGNSLNKVDLSENKMKAVKSNLTKLNLAVHRESTESYDSAGSIGVRSHKKSTRMMLKKCDSLDLITICPIKISGNEYTEHLHTTVIELKESDTETSNQNVSYRSSNEIRTKLIAKPSEHSTCSNTSPITSCSPEFSKVYTNTEKSVIQENPIIDSISRCIIKPDIIRTKQEIPTEFSKLIPSVIFPKELLVSKHQETQLKHLSKVSIVRSSRVASSDNKKERQISPNSKSSGLSPGSRYSDEAQKLQNDKVISPKGSRKSRLDHHISHVVSSTRTVDKGRSESGSSNKRDRSLPKISEETSSQNSGENTCTGQKSKSLKRNETKVLSVSENMELGRGLTEQLFNVPIVAVQVVDNKAEEAVLKKNSLLNKKNKSVNYSKESHEAKSKGFKTTRNNKNASEHSSATNDSTGDGFIKKKIVCPFFYKCAINKNSNLVEQIPLKTNDHTNVEGTKIRKSENPPVCTGNKKNNKCIQEKTKLNASEAKDNDNVRGVVRNSDVNKAKCCDRPFVTLDLSNNVTFDPNLIVPKPLSRTIMNIIPENSQNSISEESQHVIRLINEIKHNVMEDIEKINFLTKNRSRIHNTRPCMKEIDELLTRNIIKTLEENSNIKTKSTSTIQSMFGLEITTAFEDLEPQIKSTLQVKNVNKSLELDKESSKMYVDVVDASPAPSINKKKESVKTNKPLMKHGNSKFQVICKSVKKNICSSYQPTQKIFIQDQSGAQGSVQAYVKKLCITHCPKHKKRGNKVDGKHEMGWFLVGRLQSCSNSDNNTDGKTHFKEVVSPTVSNKVVQKNKSIVLAECITPSKLYEKQNLDAMKRVTKDGKNAIIMPALNNGTPKRETKCKSDCQSETTKQVCENSSTDRSTKRISTCNTQSCSNKTKTTIGGKQDLKNPVENSIVKQSGRISLPDAKQMPAPMITDSKKSNLMNGSGRLLNKRENAQRNRTKVVKKNVNDKKGNASSCLYTKSNDGPSTSTFEKRKLYGETIRRKRDHSSGKELGNHDRGLNNKVLTMPVLIVPHSSHETVENNTTMKPCQKQSIATNQQELLIENAEERSSRQEEKLNLDSNKISCYIKRAIVSESNDSETTNMPSSSSTQSAIVPINKHLYKCTSDKDSFSSSNQNTFHTFNVMADNITDVYSNRSNIKGSSASISRGSSYSFDNLPTIPSITNIHHSKSSILTNGHFNRMYTSTGFIHCKKYLGLYRKSARSCINMFENIREVNKESFKDIDTSTGSTVNKIPIEGSKFDFKSSYEFCNPNYMQPDQHWYQSKLRRMSHRQPNSVECCQRIKRNSICDQVISYSAEMPQHSTHSTIAQRCRDNPTCNNMFYKLFEVKSVERNNDSRVAFKLRFVKIKNDSETSSKPATDSSNNQNGRSHGISETKNLQDKHDYYDKHYETEILNRNVKTNNPWCGEKDLYTVFRLEESITLPNSNQKLQRHTHSIEKYKFFTYNKVGELENIEYVPLASVCSKLDIYCKNTNNQPNKIYSSKTPTTPISESGYGSYKSKYSFKKVFKKDIIEGITSKSSEFDATAFTDAHFSIINAFPVRETSSKNSQKLGDPDLDSECGSHQIKPLSWTTSASECYSEFPGSSCTVECFTDDSKNIVYEQAEQSCSYNCEIKMDSLNNSEKNSSKTSTNLNTNKGCDIRKPKVHREDSMQFSTGKASDGSLKAFQSLKKHFTWKTPSKESVSRTESKFKGLFHSISKQFHINKQTGTYTDVRSQQSYTVANPVICNRFKISKEKLNPNHAGVHSSKKVSLNENNRSSNYQTERVNMAQSVNNQHQKKDFKNNRKVPLYVVVDKIDKTKIENMSTVKQKVTSCFKPSTSVDQPSTSGIIQKLCRKVCFSKSFINKSISTNEFPQSQKRTQCVTTNCKVPCPAGKCKSTQADLKKRTKGMEKAIQHGSKRKHASRKTSTTGSSDSSVYSDLLEDFTKYKRYHLPSVALQNELSDVALTHPSQTSVGQYAEILQDYDQPAQLVTEVAIPLKTAEQISEDDLEILIDASAAKSAKYTSTKSSLENYITTLLEESVKKIFSDLSIRSLNKTESKVTSQTVAGLYENILDKRHSQVSLKSEVGDLEKSGNTQAKSNMISNNLDSRSINESLKSKSQQMEQLRESLTDQEMFEKLLESYEKEEKIVDRLSNDEKFFESQLKMVKSKESAETLIKVDELEERSLPGTLPKSSVENILRFDSNSKRSAKPGKAGSTRSSRASTSTNKSAKSGTIHDRLSSDARSNKDLDLDDDDLKNVKFSKEYKSATKENMMPTDDSISIISRKSLNRKLKHNQKDSMKKQNEDSNDSCVVKPEDLGKCFLRGFRADYKSLSGHACLKTTRKEKEMRKKMQIAAGQVIDFSERESPLEYLLALGFSIDEASNAIKDEDVKNRLFAAITEARVWINQIDTMQGTLLYLVAYKAKPRTMRYFLQLVEAIINRRINNAVKLDAFLRVLEKVEDGDLTMVNILGTDKFEDEENEEKIVKKQLRDLFIKVYRTAEHESNRRSKPLTKEAVILLRILAAKYRAGLHPHLELIARYIGQELLVTDVQLEAAMIYLSRLDTANVNLDEFEQYCGIKCEKKKMKRSKN